MQKLAKNYSNDNKDNNIFLSKRLAELEDRNKIPISGVMIEVSNDTNNLVADLSLSPLPTLKAKHNDNTNEDGFYVNLYRWWKSTPGKDISNLMFPEDFSVVNISQTTDLLTNLLDNVGSGRYVALSVTPVDIHGFRGDSLVSSNYVFVKGTEWRIGSFPWADMNNDYNLDGNDVRIGTERIKELLDAKIHSIPYYLDNNQLLPIKNSSLFVPMNIEPGGGQTPGTLPIEISDPNVIDWSFENNINLAKNIEVKNGSNVNITAGTGGNSGSIYLYPYVELNLAEEPVFINGAPKLINFGATIRTTGDINFKTLSRGNIELLNHNELTGKNIGLEARGSIIINDSSLNANNDITFNTLKDLGITGERFIKLHDVVFSSINSDKKVKFETKSDILFKGGGWSSNQTLYIPDDRNILFTRGAEKVSNSGKIDVSNTGRIYFEHSMGEDLARSLRVRLEKETNDTFLLTTLNYHRNVDYASSLSNQKVVAPNLWTKLGSGNHNFEFSTRVISGPGTVDDLAYSFDGNGEIKIGVTTTQQIQNTRVKFDVRDRYNTEIVGFGFFNYSVSNTGIPSIIIENPPPIDYYTITFNTNNGSVIPSIGGYVDDSVGPVADPTKIGHEFVGWDKTIPTKIPDYDLEITALWNALVYTVTIDSKGGSAINDLHYKYGEQIYIPIPIRAGYTWSSWEPSPPQTMPANNLHFNAEWTKKKLTINFDANGGTLPTFTTKNVYIDLPYGELPSTTRTGYVFKGWYTGISNDTKISDTTNVEDPTNHTLYAQWSSTSVKSVSIYDPDDDQYKTYIKKEVPRNHGNITVAIKIEPETASNKKVTWTSSNKNVASVNNGTIIINNSGTTNIKVTTDDGGHSATLELVVKSSSGCY